MITPGTAAKKLKFIWAFVEVLVFLVIASGIGFFAAFMLIILSAICGVALLKQKGGDVLKQMNQKIQRGERPNEEMVRTIAACFAGMLLIIPGFVTSLIAILILIPAWRNKVVNWLIQKKYFTSHQKSAKKTAANDDQGRVIDGESWRDED